MEKETNNDLIKPMQKLLEHGFEYITTGLYSYEKENWEVRIIQDVEGYVIGIIEDSRKTGVITWGQKYYDTPSDAVHNGLNHMMKNIPEKDPRYSEMLSLYNTLQESDRKEGVMNAMEGYADGNMKKDIQGKTRKGRYGRKR